MEVSPTKLPDQLEVSPKKLPSQLKVSPRKLPSQVEVSPKKSSDQVGISPEVFAKLKITSNDSNTKPVNGTNGMDSNGNPKPSNGNVPKPSNGNVFKPSNGTNFSLTKRENGIGVAYQQPEKPNGLPQLPKPPQIPPRTRPPLPLPPTSPPKIEIPTRIASQSMRYKQHPSTNGDSQHGAFGGTNPFVTNGNCDDEIKQIEANDKIDPCKTGAYPKIKTTPTATKPTIPPKPTSPTTTANYNNVGIPIPPRPSKYCSF